MVKCACIGKRNEGAMRMNILIDKCSIFCIRKLLMSDPIATKYFLNAITLPLQVNTCVIMHKLLERENPKLYQSWNMTQKWTDASAIAPYGGLTALGKHHLIVPLCFIFRWKVNSILVLQISILICRRHRITV